MLHGGMHSSSLVQRVLQSSDFPGIPEQATQVHDFPAVVELVEAGLGELAASHLYDKVLVGSVAGTSAMRNLCVLSAFTSDRTTRLLPNLLIEQPPSSDQSACFGHQQPPKRSAQNKQICGVQNGYQSEVYLLTRRL